MISTTGSVASLLSQVYQKSTDSLNTSLQRISSGKRVNSSSDDFSAFVKASSYNGYITTYSQNNQNLGVLKQQAMQAKATGDAIVTQLTKLQEIATAYTNGDANAKTAANAQYSAVKATITSLAGATYAGSTLIGTTQIGTTTDGISVVSATNAVDTSAAGLGGDASNVGALANETTNLMTFVTKMQGFADQINAKIALNSTAISSAKTAVSALVDVDEAEEMGNMTNMQVRLQASAAMMSQANVSQAAIARLFQ